jgi:putative FmdB family regulatory protein
MPTYEYACKACGEHLEVVQSFKDDSLTTCPACGGPLRKVFGSIGIAFKGSGFYRTDSRPAAAKRDKSETAASSDGSTSAEGTAKPDTAGGGAKEAGGAAAKEAAGAGAKTGAQAGKDGAKAKGKGSGTGSGKPKAAASA